MIYSSHHDSTSFKNFLGSEFEDYEEVGFGFSGSVLKSLHRPTNRILARKIIHETPRRRRELFKSGSTRITYKEADFYRKIVLSGGCKNIVKCFGVMPAGTKGHLHGGLVFEFMDLGSLADLLHHRSHHPLPEPFILTIAQNLLQACAYLEGLGIVHRDIKPSNILFDRGSGVKLCDFGEACYAWESENQQNKSSRMAGSTAYMSPERLASLSHSHSADIWSVGLVLLELTSSTFPFAISSSNSTTTTSSSSDSCASFDGNCSIIELWETVMEVEHLPKVSTDFYSSDLVNLVSLCMRKDPNTRPTAKFLLEQFSIHFENNKAKPDEVIQLITSF